MRCLLAIVVVLLLVLLRAGVAMAECRVAVDGEPMGSLRHRASWLQAENELMRSSTIAAADCANIRLTFDEDEAVTSGVRMVVRMRDDRRAERVVAKPDELVPTALMVLTTTAAAPAMNSDSDSESESGSAAGAPAAAEVALPAPPDVPKEKPLLAPAPPRETITFGLQGGVRGGADALASPTASAFASLTLRRWEAGLLGGADAGYQSLEPATATGNVTMHGSSMNVGAFIGRREPAGSVFEFFFGGRAVLAFVTGSSTVQTRTGFIENTTMNPESELRTGAYVGTAFPRKLPIRFRTDLALDAVPSLGQSADEHEVARRTPAITPWWTACLQIGLEIAR